MGLTSVVAGVAWVAFLCAAGYVALRHRHDRVRRRRGADLMLGVALVISFTAGVTRKSLWPFEAWPMFRYVLTEVITTRSVVVVDAEGRVHPVDARAWQPLQAEELMSWFGAVFPTLSPDATDRVGTYLLDKLTVAGARAARGEDIGYLDRFLGPFTAPTHFLHRRFWDDAAAVPRTPLLAWQLVEDTWHVDDPDRVERRVVYEFRRSP